MIRTLESQTIKEQPQMRGGTGVTRVQQLFLPEEFGAKVRLCARLTLPPGASIGEHEHHAEDEVYVIMRGEALLRDNGVETRIGPGDAVLTGDGGSHSIANAGSEELELLAFIVCYPAAVEQP